MTVLKMLRFPCVFGPKVTTTYQKACVFGHLTFQMFNSTTNFEGQNAELRLGSQFRQKINAEADLPDPADPVRELLF